MPSGSSRPRRAGRPPAPGALPRWRTISSRKNGLPLVSSDSARLTCSGMPCRPELARPARRRPPRRARAARSARSSARAGARRGCRRAPSGRSVSRKVATISTGDASAERTIWRSISSVGLSAQCRSSSTSTTGWARAISASTSDDGIEQPVALGRLRRRRGLPPSASSGTTRPSSALPAARAGRGDGACDVAAQRFHERLVGHQRLGVAAAVQRQRAGRLALGHELERQARLADPRLALEQHELAAAAGGALEVVAQPLELAAAADERRAAAGGEERVSLVGDAGGRGFGGCGGGVGVGLRLLGLQQPLELGLHLRPGRDAELVAQQRAQLVVARAAPRRGCPGPRARASAAGSRSRGTAPARRAPARPARRVPARRRRARGRRRRAARAPAGRGPRAAAAAPPATAPRSRAAVRRRPARRRGRRLRRRPASRRGRAPRTRRRAPAAPRRSRSAPRTAAARPARRRSRSRRGRARAAASRARR